MLLLYDSSCFLSGVWTPTNGAHVIHMLVIRVLMLGQSIFLLTLDNFFRRHTSFFSCSHVSFSSKSACRKTIVWSNGSAQCLWARFLSALACPVFNFAMSPSSSSSQGMGRSRNRSSSVHCALASWKSRLSSLFRACSRGCVGDGFVHSSPLRGESTDASRLLAKEDTVSTATSSSANSDRRSIIAFGTRSLAVQRALCTIVKQAWTLRTRTAMTLLEIESSSFRP